MSLQTIDSDSSSIRSISPGRRPELRITRSFTRLESHQTDEDPLSSSLSRLKSEVPQDYEDSAVLEESEDDDSIPVAPLLPEGFDELPPELVTLADRFIESLTQPVLPSPPTIGQLSEMFQQFYGTASQEIGKYVSKSYLSVTSKRPRSKMPTQMLSKAEMAQKKRDRKMLEVGKTALEEAMEKKVTGSVYEKLWRHKSTDDEARDDSLHSKIAAFKVIGVNMGHLGVELDSTKKKAVDFELQEAIQSLIAMNENNYPQGKLKKLKHAHKTIVDCLTKHISSTSADALLPALIYTLIICPPEQHLNAISNLFFTQRFRSSNLNDGESAYCLTNLEAAISFLETVDLATLKIPDIGGTGNSSPHDLQTPPQAWSPADDPLSNLSDKLTKAHATAAAETTTISEQNLSLPNATVSFQHNNRKGLSILTPIDLATSAVSTADQSIRGIGFALESSYKFLFDNRGDDVPKTLEEARKFVKTPTSVTGLAPSPNEESGDAAMKQELKSRTDPLQVASPSSLQLPSPSTPPPGTKHSTGGGLDPLKTIGSSFGRIANIGMRGFGRSIESPQPSPSLKTPDRTQKFNELGPQGGSPNTASYFPADERAQDSILPKLDYKVNHRFMTVESSGELRVHEVQELLSEYRKVVGELKNKGLVK